MMIDEAIKYHALYQEVELAISNIHNLGFDTTVFQARLKEIHNDVSLNVKVKYVKGMVEASYIQSYSNGIFALNKLKNMLDNYDVYVRAQNTCNYINMKLKKDMTSYELSKCVSQMIYTMQNIIKSNTIDYDDEKHIIEKIYETAYSIIKLEIILNGESQLYLFAKKENINISYFNNLVMKDIERIKLNDNHLIKTKLYELGGKGIYSNYFDLELIKLIILSDKNVNLKNVIINKIRILCNEIIESDKLIRDNYHLIDSKEDKRKIALVDLKRIKKEYKKRLTSLVLSASIITSGFVGIPFISKRLSKNYEYNFTNHTYSSVSDYYGQEEEESILFFGKGTKADHYTFVYLDTYSKKNDDFKARQDIGYLEFEDIYGYVNYVKEHYNEFINDDNMYYKIELKNYQKVNTDSFPWALTFLLYVGYLMLLMFYCSITLLEPFEINKIKDLKNKLDEETVNLNEIQAIINECLEKMMADINKNDELREKFMKLFNDNLFLLDDTNELLRRVRESYNTNNMEQVKKYVREKKM